MLEPSGLITICDKFIHLRLRQPKPKSFGEAIFIALDGLIHHARLNAIKRGKIPVNHHLYAANRKYAVANASHILRHDQCITFFSAHAASFTSAFEVTFCDLKSANSIFTPRPRFASMSKVATPG